MSMQFKEEILYQLWQLDYINKSQFNDSFKEIDLRKFIERKKQKLIEELKELLEESGIEWDDNYLNYKDYSPPFEMEDENVKWFYIILGKLIMLDEER